MEINTETGIRIVDKAYVEEFRGDLFVLIKEYYERSKDKYSTPGKVLVDILNNIGDENYLLAVHETDKVMDGFLIGKLVAGPVARIMMAFLGKGLDSRTIIRNSLEMFDGWALSHKAIASDLFTHRHPKSYASLKYLGWRHNYTVYRKDYK